jgi:hypothetical protein
MHADALKFTSGFIQGALRLGLMRIFSTGAPPPCRPAGSHYSCTAATGSVKRAIVAQQLPRWQLHYRWHLAKCQDLTIIIMILKRVPPFFASSTDVGITASPSSYNRSWKTCIHFLPIRDSKSNYIFLISHAINLDGRPRYIAI